MTVRLIDLTAGGKRTLQAVCDDDGWRGGVYAYESDQAHREANYHNCDEHEVGPLAPHVISETDHA